MLFLVVEVEWKVTRKTNKLYKNPCAFTFSIWCCSSWTGRQGNINCSHFIAVQGWDWMSLFLTTLKFLNWFYLTKDDRLVVWVWFTSRQRCPVSIHFLFQCNECIAVIIIVTSRSTCTVCLFCFLWKNTSSWYALPFSLNGTSLEWAVVPVLYMCNTWKCLTRKCNICQCG